jgi:hypothetical protein
MKITGNGNDLKITRQGKAKVDSASLGFVASNSLEEGETYIVTSESSIAASKVVALHMTNNSDVYDLLIHRVTAHTVAEAATTPAVGVYWTAGIDRTYTSGGAAVTPKNIYSDSGKDAQVTAYQTSPTIGGTDAVLDKYYPKLDGERYEMTLPRDGVVLGPDGTFEVSYTSTGTAGRARQTTVFSMKRRAV